MKININVNNNLLCGLSNVVQQRSIAEIGILIKQRTDLDLIVVENNTCAVVKRVHLVKTIKTLLRKVLIVSKELGSFDVLVISLQIATNEDDRRIVGRILIIVIVEQILILVDHITKYNVINSLRIICGTCVKKKLVIIVVLLRCKTKSLCHNSAYFFVNTSHLKHYVSIRLLYIKSFSNSSMQGFPASLFFSICIYTLFCVGRPFGPYS